MSKESIKLKVSMPFMDKDELNKLDSFYNNIVDDYLKCFVKEKEQFTSQYLMKKLREENKYLKELINKTYEEFIINNISTATEQRIIFMKDNIHNEEKRKLDVHIKYLESKLKQRDEVIDEASKLLEYYYIGNLKYDKESQKVFKKLLEILNKYKEDNK